MILTLNRSIRIFLNIFFLIILIFIGGNLMENGIEFQGGLFILMTLVFVFYIAYKAFNRKYKKKSKCSSHNSTIIIAFNLALSLICLMAFIESFPNLIGISILLSEVCVFTLITAYLEYRQSIYGSSPFKLAKRKNILYTIGIAITTCLFVILVSEINDITNIITVIIVIILTCYLIYWLVSQIKIILKLKSEKNKTELIHLQSQVNPHFFFNVLNNLYGTVGKDPVKAQQLILKLSDMMRYSIYEGQKHLVKLDDEISYLKNFISLNKMRYHKTVDIQFNIDIPQESIMVMPLLYIILLENAFKHGVEKLRDNAFIHINIKASASEIKFNIKNNFELEASKNNPGIGIANLKRRLELVYPKKHNLSLSQNDNLFSAELNILLT